MEAELLVQLWVYQPVVLQSRPNSFNSVQGLNGRCSIQPNEAALYFSRKGRGMLLSTEGALHVSINCDDTARSSHFEL